MKYTLLCSVLFLYLCQLTQAQDSALVNCGQKEANDRFLRQNSAAKKFHDQIEFSLADYTRRVKSGQITAQRTNAVVTLPVVVHIVHNNGAENISDATAMAAIQHLNEAFANTGFYDPADGVNTQIQFCLAQRDPSGNATNGITRNVSPYTVMGGPQYTSDDQNVKNLNRWNPSCYINIWLVREIPGGVAGYAYLPSAHGSNLDGIVMEAAYFGSSYANDVVIIHEMGHYLGLYHTFEGSCTNSDCTTQGDRVCDTPPDQSTGWAACNTTINSCSTDPLSGFGADVSDLKEDYMDYGNFSCMKVFTQGQADRMNWHIQNVRKSLLSCKSCLSPCPAPIIANFTPSATTVPYGTTVNFTNSSTNASGYRWYVNGVLQSTTNNFSYTFNGGGTFTIRLVALSNSPLCDSMAIQQSVNVICTQPIIANFSSSANNVLVGSTVNFTNTTTNAAGFRWYINGVFQTTTPNFSNTFNTAGMYMVRLVAISSSPICDSTAIQDTVRVNCGITADFTPLSSSFNTSQTIPFTNSSTGATGYEWLVNGVLLSTGTNFTHSFNTPGNYSVKLRAIGATCTDSLAGTVVIIDTCVTNTFQKSIGGPADDKASDVQSTTDGGFIIAGRTSSFGSGNEDGFIVKTDGQGTLQWSKTYGGAENDWFNAIIKTNDGGYLAVGRTSSFGYRPGEAWVVKIDANGDTQWSRRVSDNSPNGDEAFSVVQTPDGGYAVSGADDAAPDVVDILVFKLGANGNILWSQRYNSAGTDGGMSIINDGNDVTIGGFRRGGSTYHDAILLKLDGATGNYIWDRKYDVEGSNNRIFQLFKRGNGYVAGMQTLPDFSGVNARMLVLTLDENGQAMDLKRIVAPTYLGGAGSILPLEDGSFVAIHNEDNGSPDFNLFKIGSDGTTQWAKKYPRPGIQVNTMLRQTGDGGFVSVGYTGVAGNVDIYIVKTDAQGNAPGCDAEPVQVTTERPSINTTSANPWASSPDYIPTNPVQNVRVVSQTPIVNDICSGTGCDVQPPVNDTCNERKNFTLTIGNLGIDRGYDAITLPDGGNLIVGTSNGNSGSNTDGLIIRTDGRAKIVWAKGYGAQGADVFHRIITTRDGNYVAVGQGLFRQAHISDVYVIKISPAGNVIWSRAFGAGTLNGEVGRSIVETPDGGFAIAADYNATPVTVQPLFLKLDQNGNLQWSKLLSVSGTGQSYDIVAQGDVLMGTGVVSKMDGSTTWHDGYIIKMRSSDGAILWTKNIESSGLSNRLEHMQLKNNELTFTMYNADAWNNTNCTPVIFKTDTSGNVTYARQYSLDGLNKTLLFLSGAITPDNGHVMSVSEGQFNTSPRMVRVGTDGKVNWVRNYKIYASQFLMNIKADNGGFMMIGTANDDVLLIKTNLEGSSNCGMTTSSGTESNLQVISTPAGTNYWSGTGNGNIVMIDAATNVNQHQFGSTIECIDSSNCEVPKDTADCNLITFQKTYTAQGTYHARYIHTTKDGGSIVAGAATPADIFSDGPEMDAFVMKLEADGKLQWAKKIGGNRYDDFRKIKSTSDGGYIAIGSSSSFSTNRGIYLVRLDATGNAVWSRNYSANATNSDIGLDVIQTSDGGFVFTATNDAAPPQAQGIVAKTDAAGNITWHKRLYRADGVDIHSVLEDADTLVVGADYWVAADNKYYGAIIKIRKSNGDILSSISFAPDADGRGAFATRLHKIPTGFLVGVHLILGPTYLIKQQGALRFTQNLEFENGQRIDLINEGDWPDITPSQNGGYLISQGRSSGGNHHVLYKMDKNGAIEWQKRYGSQPGLDIFMQIAANAQEYADGTIIAASTYSAHPATSEGKIHVIRTNPQGETRGCLYGDFYDVRHNMAAQTAPITWTNSAFNYNQSTAVTSTVVDVNMEVRERCDPACDIDTLIGTDTICSLNDTATYELKRTGHCTEPVEWSIDTDFADIISTTDTTIRLKFKKTGIVTLYARLNRSCDILVDSIVVNVFHSPDTLNIGPDLVLCKISTWPLNARSGFKSYLWQDGSTDSTFTVYDPGIYHVTVTDFCGNQLRDTVIVSLSPDLPFDLGPDLPVCDKDTLSITAPAGFSNYYWSPGYRVSNSYTPVIRVYPDRDTTYTVVAERAPGCLVTDTIRVIVRRPTPLDLPADTAFCRKDSVLLDAGPAFNSYLWNNGLTTQQIYATTGGDYVVEATDINGCKSRDTVAVTINALPVVNLGGDTLLCRNTAIHFIPTISNVVNTYLWQDGTTLPTFTATAPGTYWVEVTNIDECKNSDTVNITGIIEPPSNFLADTIGVCDGEPIEIRANGNFTRYRWDNTFSTASIMVDRAGVHILEVTDANGCTGIDSIRVYAKDCAKQIFFPNAFTPNNDGQHDIWKPIVRGRMAKFHLVIYNRWGGKVFETNDTSLGWNGMLNQLQQGTNVFVWMCTYKFVGNEQVEHKEKGTLTLIR